MSNLLNAIIKFSLSNRLLVVIAALLATVYGTWQITQMPIDVFPDLNRPRVVIMTEAHGLAPEEVESLISIPLETALNGATGVQEVRSSSGVAISAIYVEFDWNTDIIVNRQIVNERIAMVAETLPEGIVPQLAPISSIMGQIMLVGITSETNKKTLLFTIPRSHLAEISAGTLPQMLVTKLREKGYTLSGEERPQIDQPDVSWIIPTLDSKKNLVFVATKDNIEIHRRTSPMHLRTLSDWVVRQQLLTIKGVSQIFVMGGGRKQYQVLINPYLLIKYNLTLHDVKEALEKSNQNATGGYLEQQGPKEILVRAIGRIQTLEDLQQVVIASEKGERPITLRQVARVIEGPQVKRGDSSAYVRDPNTGKMSGGDSIVLTINKQPAGDTREVTEKITAVLKQLQTRMPDDVRLYPNMYQQKTFIDLAIANVVEALRDGTILVVIILIIFLFNLRVTFITLTAIPLSIVTASLVFRYFDLSINTMTLGGLAVAIGELVDDAIVDVENIYRRLRENAKLEKPDNPLRVVFQASVEVRSSIVYGTMIVVLVFLPLFGLTGMEGRLFAPLGIAYIVSLLCSLVVSLTVTPILSYWLLANKKSLKSSHNDDTLLLRLLKKIASLAIRFSLRVPSLVLIVAVTLVSISGWVFFQQENDFLPPFNEGAVQINVLLPPGASLKTSNKISQTVSHRLQSIPEILTLVRKTGRAELDEHAEGVNTSEYIASIDANSEKSREEVLESIREQLADIPGIVVGADQPLAHLISHMISGVKAQIAIKVFGSDLAELRRIADEIKTTIGTVDGVKDLQVEAQTLIPQLRITVDAHQLVRYGLTRGDVTEFIEAAMSGEKVSSVRNGQRSFDLVAILDKPYREDIPTLRRLQIPTNNGKLVRLEDVATLTMGVGPNTIKRENVRRRIVIQCNVANRGLVDTVNEIKERLAPLEKRIPEDYRIAYGGQFESQKSASRTLLGLFVIALIGMFLVLYSMFKSVNLSLQIMGALPGAFIGSVIALVVTDQTVTVAAMVGFISLCGIASRNGILLINHYIHLVEHEGETLSKEMVVRAGQERLAPVLMTALTSGIGLLPLAMAAGAPGKEILYPIATVIIGGLISSTLLEFLVRPALFWKLGRGAIESILSNRQEEFDWEQTTEQPRKKAEQG